MTFRVGDLERYETELGCLVETRRQCNAHGLEIEHVALSTPKREAYLPRSTEGGRTVDEIYAVEAGADMALAKCARMPSLSEQMRERKKRLEAELAEVNNVLRRLEANPEAAELLDAISRLGGLRSY